MEEEKEVWLDMYSPFCDLSSEEMHPVRAGRKGIDKFFIKYNNGHMVAWPTEEDIKRWHRLYDEYIETGIKPINPNQKS